MAAGAVPSFREKISQINPVELIERKLADKNAPMTLEERIALLVGCIRSGEEQVSRIERRDAQNPIIFLGNTGSGKSTLINYLAGCEMTCIDPRKVNIQGLARRIAIVKSSSRMPEVMKIGHTKISETFIPSIATVEGRTYCDCPGFFDNRGVEINVANIVNIRRVISASQQVRIIALINYYSILGDKARGLKETIRVVQQIFKDQETFHAFRHALLVGVSQVPNVEVGDKPSPLDDLRSGVRGDGIEQHMTPYERDVSQAFAEHLFHFHVEDRLEWMEYSGGLTRHQLLEKIEQMQQIPNPQSVFKIALSPEDEAGLREICEGMGAKISESLSTGQYEDANLLLEYTRKIKLIEHPTVDAFLSQCRETVVKHFTVLVQTVHRELASDSRALTPLAQELFQKINLGLSAFDQEDRTHLELQIGLNELKETFAVHRKRIEFYESERALKALEIEFIDRCFAYDFEKSEELLLKIREKVEEANREYKDEGFISAVNIAPLEGQLERAKRMHADKEALIEQMKEEQRKYTEKLEAMEKAHAELKKEMDKKLKESSDTISSLRAQINAIQSQSSGKGSRCIIS